MIRRIASLIALCLLSFGAQAQTLTNGQGNAQTVGGGINEGLKDFDAGKVLVVGLDDRPGGGQG